MRTKLFLFALMFPPLFFSAQAQLASGLLSNEYVYVLDGTNPSFAWGRHIAPDKIAIGLADEGVFEIRNNNSIWLIDSPAMEDTQIADITKNNETGRLLFTFHIPDEFKDHGLPIDTIGGYDLAKQDIYDKQYREPIANIFQTSEKGYGNVVSAQGELYATINVKTSNKVLSAFFLLYHCLQHKPMGSE